jgi:protein TonB
MVFTTTAASTQTKTTAKNSVKHKKTLVKKHAKKVVINNPRPDYFEVKSNIQEELVFDTVEEPAQFPGGMKALYEFLAKNLTYPLSAREANIQGRVIIGFIVEKSGKLSGITLVKGLENDFDKEALRVVSIMPDWIAGKNNHIPVRSRYYLPIMFKLEASE